MEPETNTVSGGSRSMRELRKLSLEDLATLIRGEHNRSEDITADARKRGGVHAINAGRALMVAREKVQRGHWERWCVDNTRHAESTRQRYMQLSHNEKKLTDKLSATELEQMTVRQLRALCKKKPAKSEQQPIDPNVPKKAIVIPEPSEDERIQHF